MLRFDIDGRHVGGKNGGFEESEIMCTMGNGCILEEDIPNIHKFAMDNWDERWIKCQGFTFFNHLQLFGLQSLSQIGPSGFNAKAEVKALLFGVSDHANAEAFSHGCAGIGWGVE